jgi:hypothetical protein
MLDKNQIMKDEIKRLVELVNCSSEQIKESYKLMIKDLMNAIAIKDWKLLDECQQIINENYIKEV